MNGAAPMPITSRLASEHVAASYPLAPLAWEVGFTSDPSIPPAEFVPANVPGAVQLDWARAKGLPDYTVGSNFRQFRFAEDVYWVYRARLELPQAGKGERVYFYCGGVDYRFQVYLQGELCHDQEGMFTPFEIDLTGRARPGDEISVVIFPAPKATPSPEDRTQARLSNKPPVSYGWDWHPRLIPCGIWQETGVQRRPARHFRAVDFRYRLSDDLTSADLDVRIETSDPGAASAAYRLRDPEGKEVVSSERPEARLEGVRLWWPNGEGKPELYTLEVLLDGAVVHARKVGFRRVRLVMHEGAWDEPARFPKSRSRPPVTLEVNGRTIFARGSNWVCPEIFPGIIDEGVYRPLLELAKGAHFNLLRTWGGAIINKEAFYELCDELGLMVWTEFHLACNLYEGEPSYLRVLEQEAESTIRRVRQHPSLAFWCGGNELFNVWSGMTDQSLPLRLLNKLTYELDRDTPFIPTAPLDGMGHGDYRFRDEHGREPHQIFASASNTAYSEFGCPGPSDVEYLETFIPEAELFPPRAGTAWEAHHGFGAWNMDPGSWLCQATIEHYFGPQRTLEELVERGQLLQCEGYKFIFEEARRQKPVCAMALNWCFNEPWPSAANNNLISWPHRPKPAYHAVKAACRPVLASARAPKFGWKSGEEFRADLFVLNDAPEPVASGTLEARVVIAGRTVARVSWQFPELEPRRNEKGPTLSFLLPRFEGDTFQIELAVADRPALDSSYTFAYARVAERRKPAPGERFLNG